MRKQGHDGSVEDRWTDALFQSEQVNVPVAERSTRRLVARAAAGEWQLRAPPTARPTTRAALYPRVTLTALAAWSVWSSSHRHSGLGWRRSPAATPARKADAASNTVVRAALTAAKRSRSMLARAPSVPLACPRSQTVAKTDVQLRCYACRRQPKVRVRLDDRVVAKSRGGVDEASLCVSNAGTCDAPVDVSQSGSDGTLVTFRRSLCGRGEPLLATSNVSVKSTALHLRRHLGLLRNAIR